MEKLIAGLAKPLGVNVTPISHRRIEKLTGRKYQSRQGFELRIHRLSEAKIVEWTKPKMVQFSDFVKSLIGETANFAVEICEEGNIDADLFNLKISDDNYLPGDFVENGTLCDD